jgi:hypothetical protein
MAKSNIITITITITIIIINNLSQASPSRPKKLGAGKRRLTQVV